MFVGHFATGILMKAFFPDVPAAALLLGVGWLDIVDGLLVCAGIDKVAPNLDAGPYLFFDLVFIDWDHSLLMAVVLSVVWGALYRGRGARVAMLASAASFSHWLCDLPFHNLDLAAYPYSDAHYGWGWWARFLTGAWVMEGAFSLACALVAYVVFARRGVDATRPSIILVVLYLNLSPWLSPMKVIATLDDPWAYLLHGGLVALGFIVPGIVMSRMVDAEEARAATKTKLA